MYSILGACSKIISFCHPLEPTLNASHSNRALLQTRRINLVNCLSTLLSSTSQQVLFHLELQATVLSQQHRVLSGIVFSGEERRHAFLSCDFSWTMRFSQEGSLFAELSKHGILGKKLML